MKRKGFTLIEMMAVIAILGILVLLVTPNVLKSFRDSKKVAFIDEAKILYTQATDTFVLDKTKGRRITYFSNDGEEKEELDIKNDEGLKYTIVLNKKGDVESFLLKNTEFCIVGVGDFLNDYTKEQVIDFNDLGSGIDEEAIALCTGDTYQYKTNLTVKLAEKIDDHVKVITDPREITLKYGDGWYDDPDGKSLLVAGTENDYKINTIPVKTNYYYEGSVVDKKTGNDEDNVNVIGCDGKVLVNNVGKDPNGKLLFKGSANYPTAGAVFKPKTFTISFSSTQTPGQTIKSKTCTYGLECKLPKMTISREGYTFKGWLYDNNRYADEFTFPIITDYNENEIVDGIDLSKFKFDNEKVCKGEQQIPNTKTFTADWEAIKYKISYDCNGGNGEMSNTDHEYDKEKALETNTCTRVGYDFKGWSRTKNGNKEFDNSQSVINLTTENNSTVTLYAVWKPRVLGLDINPDFNIYGRDYSKGSNVKSFDLKIVSESGETIYQANGISDYCSEGTCTGVKSEYNATYYISNVVYRDNYHYKSATLRNDIQHTESNLPMITNNSTEFSFKHTYDGDMWFSINTEPDSTFSFAYTGPFSYKDGNANWVTTRDSSIDLKNENWYVKLLDDGNLIVNNLSSNVDVFLVGGGGGGGSSNTWAPYGFCNGGGGGAGGYTKTVKNISFANGKYSVTIGDGGKGAKACIFCTDETITYGEKGGTTGIKLNSNWYNDLYANGGGGGKAAGNAFASGGNGGSGGGTGGSLERYNGANGGTNGGNASWRDDDGKHGKGQGTTTKEFAESSGTLYSGGGAGGRNYDAYADVHGDAGKAGDATAGEVSKNGKTNTGGGGGGENCYYGAGQGGDGGSGIIILRNKR
jgi:prepilin-type N-terminal cleavage/methylation domain-containing protein/uncharacterized repeat protein (TIGR02543 family)